MNSSSYNPQSGNLNVLIIYDTYEFGSGISNALDSLGITISQWLIARSEATLRRQKKSPIQKTAAELIQLASGHYRLKKKAAEQVAKSLANLGHQSTIVNINNLRIRNSTLTHKGKPFNLGSFHGVWYRFAPERLDLSLGYPRQNTKRNMGIATFIEERICPVTSLAMLTTLDSKLRTQNFFEATGMPLPRSCIIFCEESHSPKLDKKIDGFLASLGKGPYVLQKDYGSGGASARWKGQYKADIYGTFISDNPAKIKAVAHRWLRQASFFRASKGVILKQFIDYQSEWRADVAVSPESAKVFCGIEWRQGNAIALKPDEGVPEISSTQQPQLMPEAVKNLASQVGSLCGFGCFGIDILGDTDLFVSEANPNSSLGFWGPADRLHRDPAGFAKVYADTIVRTLRHKYAAAQPSNPSVT